MSIGFETAIIRSLKLIAEEINMSNKLKIIEIQNNYEMINVRDELRKVKKEHSAITEKYDSI